VNRAGSLVTLDGRENAQEAQEIRLATSQRGAFRAFCALMMGATGVIRRGDLVRDQLDHPPLGTMLPPTSGSPVRVGISGSGADLLVLAWSAAQLARERAAGVRMLAKLGIGSGTRVANALPGALATPGSLLLGDVVQDLGGLDIPVGEVDNEAAGKQAWSLIDLVEPDVIVLNAQSARHLLAAAPARQRSWWKGVVWLRTDAGHQATSKPPSVAGFEGWQRTWLAVPEATSFVAVSCSAGRFHLDTEVTAEAVDGKTLRAAKAGEAASIALTTTGGETAVECYLSNLRGRLAAQSCACGDRDPAWELEDGLPE
jgi:hypothetical protein